MATEREEVMMERLASVMLLHQVKTAAVVEQYSCISKGLFWCYFRLRRLSEEQMC